MRFHTPDRGVLQVDRVGGLRTYAARMDGGGWTPWGELHSVIVEASGLDPEDPWIGRVVGFVRDGEALVDVPGEPAPTPRRMAAGLRMAR